MPLIDDLSFQPSEEELARRRFLGLAGSGALAAMVAGTGVTTISFLSPQVLFEESSKFKVGRPGDIQIGTLLVLEKQKAFVFRSDQGFFAMSSVCTHLGCMTRYVAAEKRIFCPCHGSKFSSEDGSVVGGPAPRPLQRLQLSVEKGILVVDTKAFMDSNEMLRV